MIEFFEFMEQIWVWPLLFTLVMGMVVYRSLRKKSKRGNKR